MNCDYCDEEIKPGERGDNHGGNFHRECLFRACAGSVGHLNGRCHCYGGIEGDPPGMTRRQGAQAALARYLEMQGATQ